MSKWHQKQVKNEKLKLQLQIEIAIKKNNQIRQENMSEMLQKTMQKLYQRYKLQKCDKNKRK